MSDTMTDVVTFFSLRRRSMMVLQEAPDELGGLGVDVNGAGVDSKSRYICLARELIKANLPNSLPGIAFDFFFWLSVIVTSPREQQVGCCLPLALPSYMYASGLAVMDELPRTRAAVSVTTLESGDCCKTHGQTCPISRVHLQWRNHQAFLRLQR